MPPKEDFPELATRILEDPEQEFCPEVRVGIKEFLDAQYAVGYLKRKMSTAETLIAIRASPQPKSFGLQELIRRIEKIQRG